MTPEVRRAVVLRSLGVREGGEVVGGEIAEAVGRARASVASKVHKRYRYRHATSRGRVLPNLRIR